VFKGLAVLSFFLLNDSEHTMNHARANVFRNDGAARLPVLLLAILLVLAGCDGADPPTPPPENDLLPRDALYVCNQSAATISVISTEANAVVETLDLTDYDFSENAKPHHVVVEPDGSAFYVSLIGENMVAKFDRAGNLVGTAPFEAPGMLALHPEDDLLYAGHTMSIINVPSTVAVIQRSDMTLAETVEVGIDRPHGIGVHPEGGFAYAGSLSENRLAAINTETQTVSIEAQEGDEIQRYVHFALSADGRRLYATGQDTGTLRVFDVSTPATPRLVETIDVNAEPWHPVFSDERSTVYFGNKGAGTVTVVNTVLRDGTLQPQVIEDEAITKPHGSALSPGGQRLYISNNQPNGTVVVIGTGSREVVNVIDVGAGAAGIGTRGGT
jgi:DNA-binding beta-propeller fold protein YncE